jgi:hypothetical protein
MLFVLFVLVSSQAQHWFESEPRPGAGVAVNGNDLVAYHSLASGQKDVVGSPRFSRRLNVSSRLAHSDLTPSSVHALHPSPFYEFWFISNENAQKFEQSPYKYLPAFGGHCTHGIASRNDLNTTLLMDGRVAFTCVNTTKWAIVNGTLYMNSCGMYDDFIKDPEKDITTANALWQRWFGGADGLNSTNTGPINDACFQDGGRWTGPPNWTADLIPDKCCIN